MQPLNTWFYLRKGRDSKCSIYVRIWLGNENEKEKPFSTGQYIEKIKWDQKKQRVKGSSIEACHINDTLQSIELKLKRIYCDFVDQGKYASLDLIVDCFKGKIFKNKTLLEMLDLYLQKMLLKKEKNKITIKTYKRHVAHVGFLKNYLNYIRRKDLYLKEVDYQFLKNFEEYGLYKENVVLNGVIIKQSKWGENHLARHLNIIRVIIEEAIKTGEIKSQDSPFNTYETVYDQTHEFRYLTIEELDRIETHDFKNERLRRVRDVFVFCCYTGIAYTDAHSLTKDSLLKNVDGTTIINEKRQKTGVEFTVPLLDPALRIIDRYKDDFFCIHKGKLLPVISNAKYNEYLGEVAALCEIEKKLTSHVGRHTAATMLLRYGVPVETISKVLGVSIKVLLQVYGDIQKEKVIEDMMKVNSLIQSKQAPGVILLRKA